MKSPKTTWPADKVERRSVESLVPYARNARTHSDAQVAQIAASITEWGWTTPVLVDEKGGIIAGHGRVMAARKLGLMDVPVMVASGWSEAQKRAYVLADNKLALNAGWDAELLKIELGELQELSFDLSLTGFSDDELANLTASKTDGLTDPDAAPEAGDRAVTAAGDGHLWATDRKQTTILEFDKPARNGEHPTMKPVALFTYQILNNTKGGDLVLDSFGGSGTTVIACEQHGRFARVIELDPIYCDVIVKRWQDFTGQKATLESDGRTFEDVAAARYDWKQDATGSYDAAIAEKRKELTDARA